MFTKKYKKESREKTLSLDFSLTLLASVRQGKINLDEELEANKQLHALVITFTAERSREETKKEAAYIVSVCVNVLNIIADNELDIVKFMLEQNEFLENA